MCVRACVWVYMWVVGVCVLIADSVSQMDMYDAGIVLNRPKVDRREAGRLSIF